MKIYNSIDELIGSTPLLRLKGIEKAFGLKAELIAKLEYFNPTGSAKDRAARAMIDDAEKSGKLKPGATIIEPTSGNTGIALCSVAVARGYKTIIVMPETMSEERRKLMKAYGATLVLTEGSLGMAGAIKKANELIKEIPGSFLPDQFGNKANAYGHYTSTGPEIVKDTDGRLDIFIASVGTGGTITGTGKYLKENVNGVKIIGVEPESSPVLSGGKAGPHKIQGIGAGFIPDVLDTSVYDEIVTVSNDDAFLYGKMFGEKEGFLSGISSGAVLSAAVKVASRPENEGKRIVILLTDSGDRYLSTPLYD